VDLATNNHVVRDALNNLTVSNAGEPGDTSVPEETVRKMAEQIELDRMLSFGDDKETQKHALVGCDPVIAAAWEIDGVWLHCVYEGFAGRFGAG
jgi:hypothetical protein